MRNLGRFKWLIAVILAVEIATGAIVFIGIFIGFFLGRSSFVREGPIASLVKAEAPPPSPVPSETAIPTHSNPPSPTETTVAIEPSSETPGPTPTSTETQTLVSSTTAPPTATSAATNPPPTAPATDTPRNTATSTIRSSRIPAGTSTPIPAPTPECIKINIESMWISGDEVRANVRNFNFADAWIDHTWFIWPELSDSMHVDWLRFGGTNYYDGDDYSSPTNRSEKSLQPASGGGVTTRWRVDFDDALFQPIVGTYSLTLEMLFPGWGSCVIKQWVPG